ncbi:MAG: hypothetical protein MJZ59_02600 [Paludibacteraceae bacterium]|nr:hypothetical protein [Paludibacteraceae bacterium]
MIKLRGNQPLRGCCFDDTIAVLQCPFSVNGVHRSKLSLLGDVLIATLLLIGG